MRYRTETAPFRRRKAVLFAPAGTPAWSALDLQGTDSHNPWTKEWDRSESRTGTRSTREERT